MGAEVWIPSSGSAYSQGYGLANEFLTEFQEMGIYNRGIKQELVKQEMIIMESFDSVHWLIFHRSLLSIAMWIIHMML